MMDGGANPVGDGKKNKIGWGGRRANAGRKKTKKRVGGAHRRRPPLLPGNPAHVVMYTTPSVWLRQPSMYRAVHRSLERISRRPDFRVTHISMQEQHFHLIVEATDEEALKKGMQSLTVSLARNINIARGCKGKVFAYRYHSTQIRSARQARATIAYVLNNWRHHGLDFVNRHESKAKLDEYSSAVTFQGWTMRFIIPDGHDPLPVSSPTTRFLIDEWKRFGLIDPFEMPGPRR